MGQKLGQHFLVDSAVLAAAKSRVAALVAELGIETIVEIGPGRGALTKKIWDLVPNFVAVERDEKMPEFLDFLPENSVVLADVLERDFPDFLAGRGWSVEKTLVVGNLPYYISSPIVRKFFAAGARMVPAGFFLVQKEFADRLADDSRNRGFLWWVLHRGNSVKMREVVKPKSFRPPPRVDSRFFEIRAGAELGCDFAALEKLLEKIAGYRRKTLGAIGKIVGVVVPDSLAKKRLDAVTPEEMVDWVQGLES